MHFDIKDFIMISSIIVVGTLSITFNFHLQNKGFSKTKAMTIPYTIGAALLGIVIGLILKPGFLETLIIILFLGGFVFITSFLRSKIFK